MPLASTVASLSRERSGPAPDSRHRLRQDHSPMSSPVIERQRRIEQLMVALACDMQQVPASADRVPPVAPAVDGNNDRLARAALTMLYMEDHPDTFDPWCRRFAQSRHGT